MDFYIVTRFNGEEWISLAGHDFSYYKDHKPESYTELPFRGALAMYEDVNGNFWFGTEIGVFKLENSQ